jgi:hypothetical protein
MRHRVICSYRDMIYNDLKRIFTNCGVFLLGIFKILFSSYLKIYKLGALAHAYNASYLGGRDWEDCNSNPMWGENVHETPS